MGFTGLVRRGGCLGPRDFRVLGGKQPVREATCLFLFETGLLNMVSLPKKGFCSAHSR